MSDMQMTVSGMGQVVGTANENYGNAEQANTSMFYLTRTAGPRRDRSRHGSPRAIAGSGATGQKQQRPLSATEVHNGRNRRRDGA